MKKIVSNLRPDMASIVLLAIVGLLVFSNSVHNKFLLDDNSQIVTSKLVNNMSLSLYSFRTSTFDAGSSMQGSFYRPIMIVVFSLVNYIFGLKEFWFHLFQLSIHISNAIFVYIIFRKSFDLKLSLLLSMVFLVHPINQSAVVYISNLQDPLFCFFGLISLLIITSNADDMQKIIFTQIALILSIFTKETGLVFYVLNFVYVCRSDKKILARYVALSVGSILFYLSMRFTAVGMGVGDFIMNNLSIIERFKSVPKILLYYYSNFIYPHNLSVAQVWYVDKINLVDFWLPLIFFILGISFVLLVYKKVSAKSRQMKNSFTFFLVWLCVSTFFYLQIIPLDQTVATRWFYISTIPILFFTGLAISRLKNRKTKLTILFLVTLYTFYLGVVTYNRNNEWRNGLLLAKIDSKKNTNSYSLENTLGYEYSKNNQLEDARIHYLRSVELYPNWINWNNLGSVMFKQLRNGSGDYSNEIEEAFLNSIKYKDDVDFTYENLALFYIYEEDFVKLEEFLKGSVSNFNNSRLWYLLAYSQYKNNNITDAKISLMRSLRINNNCMECKELYQLLENSDN